MGFKAIVFTGLFTFLCTKHFSQDYFGYGGSNYGGLNQVIANPANAADNRLKLDVIPFGSDVSLNNSWFGINRAALHNSGSLAHLKLPASWKNTTPNVPENVFKNFNVLPSSKDRAAVVEGRVILPSVLYQLNNRNALAFTWSVRQMATAGGISQQFANLFEKELDLSVTQNNRIQNKDLSAVQMSWAEYGLTYARVLKDRGKHFIKAGITPKLLQGFESTYLIIKDLDFLLSTKDTSSYFQTQFSYAHSANVQSPFPVKDFYRYVAKPSLALDLGIVYEWRPNYQRFKYKTESGRYAWRKDRNKYKLKLGASLNDLGKIKFQKQGTYYDLDVLVYRENFTQFTNVKDFAEFDSLLRANFSSGNGNKEFSILLPTALNLQADYALAPSFYLNLSAHLSNFYKKNDYRVYNYSAVALAPRFETYWVDVAVPLTYNALSARRAEYLMAGLNLRLGPLSIGTSNLLPFIKGDVRMFSFYALFKVVIPYARMKDIDHDGVMDKHDKCPDMPGDVALNGCPDTDHDGIPDKEDACPHQPGLALFKGCPDTDGDGIRDGDDACPTEKGSILLSGCPDADGDSVADKLDNCPTVAGPKALKGCPDTDRDGIPDKDDLCPTIKGLTKFSGCLDRDNDGVHDGIDGCADVAGPAENTGCPWPDTDKDGVIDRLDSCVTVFGLKEFKGCPAPVKLAPIEKRIIQKAVSSLEFASGKDVIAPASFPSLNALAKLLAAHKTDWQLRLSGHTDNEGAEESNLILSEKRTKALQAYLSKRGVPKENFILEWFGQSRPVADNNTKEGRQKNRRVEMFVLFKAER